LERQARITLEGAQAYVNAQVEDISFTGMQLRIAMKLPEDIFLKLNISFSEACTFEVEAWVAWHKAAEGLHNYGLYFSKISDDAKERIYRFLYHHNPQVMKSKWFDEVRGEEGGEEVDDRRVFQRFAVGLPARFIDVNKGTEGVARTQDVSAKGVGVITNVELKPHTTLEIWLDLPKGDPIYTRGEVVWAKQEEDKRYRAGINLEKADLMGLSRILRG